MASPPTSNGNQRVTNAILSTKLDALINEVQTNRANLNRRIDFLEEKLELQVGEIRGHCSENETNIARLEERQKSTTGILGVLTVILSTIAGVVGSVFK